MGGGGGRGPTRESLKRLEEIARRTLREGAGEQRRNVFISFVAEDLGDVNLLRGQAKNENSELEFSDWSLREPFESTKADYVRAGIRERIRQSSVTLVYLSDQTANSKWVDWEIRESIKLGKGVIAVHKGDKPPSLLPKAISELGITLVPWTHAGLAAAIGKAAEAR